MAEPPRLFADLNDLLGGERVALSTVGARHDLDEQGVVLSPGLRVIVYDHDAEVDNEPTYLLADGTAEYDDETGLWFALIDRTTLRSEPR